MQSSPIKLTHYRLLIGAGVAVATLMVFPQQGDKPKVSLSATPPVPVAAGTCTSSTSGYLDLNGKTAGFTDEEFGRMILPALRQGYVLTIYPPTKRGVFVSQECHGSKK